MLTSLQVLRWLTVARHSQNFDNHINEFYTSAPFLAEAQVAAPFLQELQPFLGNRSIDFTNMVRPLPLASAKPQTLTPFHPRAGSST